MSTIRVRIEVKASGVGIEESAKRYPVELGWDEAFQSTGDNPAYFASQVQDAIAKAAQQAIEFMEPYRVYPERPAS